MMMGFKIFAHTFSQDVLGLRVVGIPKPALQLPHMGHESGIKPNRGLDLCLRGSTDLPFCLDDQNHNWTAKSNAVLFSLCLHGSVFGSFGRALHLPSSDGYPGIGNAANVSIPCCVLIVVWCLGFIRVEHDLFNLPSFWGLRFMDLSLRCR